MNLQKKAEDKFCNCRNSKCMKLYCECFAARVECGKSCHCIDCHNRNNAEHLKIYKDYNTSERKFFKDQISKEHKGCACRKSGCTKKYCQCYQAGLLCREICKCIQCQNNESLSNKKVISELKRNTSSNTNKGGALCKFLYKIQTPQYQTQDARHINQILADQNPLNMRDSWIQQTAQELYKKAQQGSVPAVIEKLLEILSSLQKNVDESQKSQKKQIEQKESNMDIQDSQNSEKIKEEISQSMEQQEDALSPLSYQNLKEEDKN